MTHVSRQVPTSRAAAMPDDNMHNLGRCVQAAAVNTDTLIIVVLVHGGPLDISWLEKSDRISGILSAWYPGQVIASGSLSANPLSVTPLSVMHETVWHPPLFYSVMYYMQDFLQRNGMTQKGAELPASYPRPSSTTQN